MENRLLARMRPALRDLEPYRVEAHSDVIKLDANENPYDFPPDVLQDILRRVDGQTFTRYPDADAQVLREAIGEYTGFSAEHISVGNGSDELILNLMLTFAVGGRVLIPVPTFGMYRIHTVIAGGTPVLVGREPDFSVDAERLLQAANENAAQVIVLCSPNNPTGNTTPLETVERVTAGFDGIVVLDEAYYEFCGRTALSLVNKYANLAVLRTFSKAFGLAGLRVGYMVAQPELIRAVWRVKQPFNVDVFSQSAAAAVLENRHLFQAQVEKLKRDGAALYDRMRALSGIEVFPTEANFILFRTPLEAREVYTALLAQGVLIRDLGGPRLERCLRVSFGRPEENARFLDSLERVVSGNYGRC